MKTKKKSIPQSAFSKQAALEPDTTSVDGHFIAFTTRFSEVADFHWHLHPAQTDSEFSHDPRGAKNKPYEKNSPRRPGSSIRARSWPSLSVPLARGWASSALHQLHQVELSPTCPDRSIIRRTFFVANPTPVIFVDSGPEVRLGTAMR
jgi:hypothetical protein